MTKNPNTFESCESVWRFRPTLLSIFLSAYIVEILRFAQNDSFESLASGKLRYR